MLTRALLPALVVVLAWPLGARADVVPDGQRYVSIESHLTGTRTAGDHALFLVTVNGRDRSAVAVEAVSGDGPLAVSSGYMNDNFMLALTPAQVAELDAARQAARAEAPADGEGGLPGPLRTFVERADLARSPHLAFRTLVDQGSDAARVVYHWQLDGIGDGAVKMSLRAEALDGQGNPTSGNPSALVIILIVIGSTALAAVIAWVAWRGSRRRRA